LIYWISTNLVTNIFHYYNPDYENYIFRYTKLIPEKLTNHEISLILSNGLLLITIPFAGATYFQKLPIVKTIIAVFILVCLFTAYIYFVVEILNLDEYVPINKSRFFMRNVRDLQIAGIMVNTTLLVISYFKVKEKEV
jgi:hypothetical protein